MTPVEEHAVRHLRYQAQEAARTLRMLERVLQQRRWFEEAPFLAQAARIARGGLLTGIYVFERRAPPELCRGGRRRTP